MRVVLFLLILLVNHLFSAQEIDITGNSVSITNGDASPSVIDDTAYGYVHVTGATNAITYTINNTGDADLSVTNIGISGDGDFSITTNPGASTITAGNSITFTVTFDPSSAASKTATIQVDNDDADEGTYTFSLQGEGAYPEISITGVADGGTENFGSAHVRATTGDGSTTGNGTVTRTYTINNTGNVPLDLSGGTVLTTGTHFSKTDPAASVAAGGSTTFQVTFNPTIVGAVPDDSISITNDDQDENPYNFSLQGTGTYSEIDITGNSIAITDGGGAQDTTDDTFFGSINRDNGTSTRTYTVNNAAASTSDLTVSSITSSLGDYTISPTSMTVAAGTSSTFTVTFDPTALGDRLSTITVNSDDTNDNDGNDESVYTFSIRGIGDSNVTASTQLTYNTIGIEYAESPALTTTITPLSSLPAAFPLASVDVKNEHNTFYDKISGAVTLDVTGGANGFNYEFAFTLNGVERQKRYLFLGALKYGPNYLDGTNHWYDFDKKSLNDASADAQKNGTGYVITDNGNKMLIYLIDGGWGDDDMLANGTITDPIFPIIGVRIPFSNQTYLFLIIAILSIAWFSIKRSSAN